MTFHLHLSIIGGVYYQFRCFLTAFLKGLSISKELFSGNEIYLISGQPQRAKMIPLILIMLMISAFLLSSLLIYLFVQFRHGFKSTSSSFYGKQRIRYSIPPSINIITRRLSSYRSTASTDMDLDMKKSNQLRSHSLANNLLVSRCTNRRRSSIIDPKQMAQIQFSLPPTAEKFRRRSVAICHNILEAKCNTLDSLIKSIASSNQYSPCLVSFSIVYLQSSQLKIQFHSLTSLPSNIQQLTIKVKLSPDGRSKDLTIKNILPNEPLFAEDDSEYFVQFANVSPGKLLEKALVMKFHGKDQVKKHVHLGQVGKIHLNEFPDVQHENQINLTHEIENIKPSSAEILVALEQTEDRNLLVDIKRVKGLKIDQKQLAATAFFRVTLLDRHRLLTTHETKPFRLNSSTFSLHNPLNFNILAFDADNLDRVMIIIDLLSNANQTNEHQSIGRMKLASPYICSGTGTTHWQQFTERQAFSMWHALNKQ